MENTVVYDLTSKVKLVPVLEEISKKQLRALLSKETDEDHKAHDSRQASLPLDYTARLVFARWRPGLLDDLGKELRDHIGDFFRDKPVLELGPGIEDILYMSLFSSFEGSQTQWYSLDVSPGIIEVLSKKDYLANDNYHPLTGTMRKMPFAGKSFDVVCGMATLDSFIGISSVINEIHRVLKPHGYMIHIQDLLPSEATLFRLLANDPNLPKRKNLLVYRLIDAKFFDEDIEVAVNADGDVGGITHIQFPRQEPIQSNLYLHQALEREFKADGFATISTGLRKYSSKDTDIYSKMNVALSETDEQLPKGYIKMPKDSIRAAHYSFLIMEKV